MSTHEPGKRTTLCPVIGGIPTVSSHLRVPLYTPDFASDPHRVYREMRRKYGSLAPVELAPGVPATLVIGHRTAVRILNDPEHFPADPRKWQKDIPADCPVLPIMEWRPNASRSAGEEFLRYRRAVTASINEINLYALRATVEKIAAPLINTFCRTGAADLIRQYAFPLTFAVINDLLGCPPDIGQRVAAGMAAIFDGIEADEGDKMIGAALLDLVRIKRVEPADDITSLLLRQPAELDDSEVVHQLASFYGAGIELQQNLVANTLLLILTDDRFGGSVLDGSLSTRDALDELLFEDPPVANLLMTYPPQPILIDSVWLPAHQPVLISMAACNNDPAIRTADRTGNRSHLAWGVGPRACPAQTLAYLTAREAIDQLLDALPEMRLATSDGGLTWRPGPFHRALATLPVTFPPTPPLNPYE
ncbi:cytochrome P450 [Nocardia beijingensis]|uniref:Cytochrome P450 n=1 Tax=Nocardia beijingensis TaxID=95162 RepID=A0ABW7WTA6_9NOCA